MRRPKIRGFTIVTRRRLVPQTWTKKRVGIIIFVAVAYGAWFNYLDSITYCKGLGNQQDCIDVGKMFGNNNFYQPWNVIGHCIPGLFMLLLKPKKLELFIAGILISSAVMDSPLWGVMRISHGELLWHQVGDDCYAKTNSLSEWIVYYYNPFGHCQVWKDPWPWPGMPTSALIFWSLVVRIVAAGGLIWLQERQEAMNREFSLKNIILNRRWPLQVHKMITNL